MLFPPVCLNPEASTFHFPSIWIFQIQSDLGIFICSSWKLVSYKYNGLLLYQTVDINNTINWWRNVQNMDSLKSLLVAWCCGLSLIQTNCEKISCHALLWEVRPGVCLEFHIKINKLSCCTWTTGDILWMTRSTSKGALAMLDFALRVGRNPD